jgi:ribosomal protein S18 acetylase RimI-like enzyme
MTDAGGEAVTLRAVRAGDIDAIVDMHLATWKVAYRGQLPDDFLAGLDATRPRRLQIWRESLANDQQRHRVAVVGRRILGFSSVGPARSRDLPPGVGELYAIYVHPTSWDSGVGRALLLEAEDDLRALGYRRAVLWVLGTNRRARAFYERGGWQADGATNVDRRPGAELHEVRYARELVNEANASGLVRST